MKQKLTKATALLLSLIFMLTTLMSLPVMTSAAPEIIDIYPVAYPRGGSSSSWGTPALTFMNSWKMDEKRLFTVPAAANKGMKVAYCVQPNVPLDIGNKSPEILPEHFLDTYNNGSLNATEIQRLLGRLFQYGYSGSVSTDMSDKQLSEEIATQLLVWEVIVGERASDFSYIVPSSGLNRVTETIKSEHPLRAQIFDEYDRIVNSVQKHSKLPSFMRASLFSALTHELKWDGTKYAVTLEDTNNVLSGFDFTSSAPNVSFSKSGNTLTVSTNSPPQKGIEISASKSSSVSSAVTFWCSNKIEVQGEVQGLVMSGMEIADPIPAYMKLKVSTGNLAILKTTQNNGGLVSGFQFRVTNQDGGAVGTYTSGTDGRINIPDLVAGWYKVEEINLSDEFVKPTKNPVLVEVKSGQTATVNFENIKKMGVITVQKSNVSPTMGDYSLEGAEFTVKNESGNTVNIIKTGADGKGLSKPLPLGSYIVYESKAPWGFIVDKNVYSRTLSGLQGVEAIVYCPEITISEHPQVGQVKITKRDNETAATAQGDSTLSSAVFDLLNSSGKQVERLYCGSNIFALSKEIPLGKYIVKEVTPPKGYTLSEKEHVINIDYAGQEVEINLVSTEIKNTVIKGNIQIVKHSDEADPAVDPKNGQVQKPLENIVFEVYLKSAGSYEKSKASERDRLITDEKGYARTKNLPYGVYVVHEVQGAPEHKVCEPFEVFISEDGRTYFYIVENPAYFGKVKIIKIDATTGKTIPQAGVEFKVKNTDTDKWVSQEILYPTPMVIDSYFTGGNGWLVMPQDLPFGNYELHEIQSPYGYTLSDKPVAFKITSDNPQDFLEVKMPNQPVMGNVTVEKKGEMLVGSEKNTNNDTVLFTPKYEVRGLFGATFDIIARTDVITPDGTIRAKAGDIVDTITTGIDGKAESKPLFLGEYYVVERTAPHGMILDTKAYDFMLTYENQLVSVVSAQVGVYNERQKAEIKLIKVCEIPESTPENYNPYSGVIFGLYAKEGVKTSEGETVIPAGGLLELIGFEKDGKAKINTNLPFGSYYVQEIQTTRGYIIDDIKYDFAFEYVGQETAVVEIKTNQGVPIINQLIRGKVKLIKTDISGKRNLSGAVFDLFDSSGNKLGAYTTDKNGEILIDNLPYGIGYRFVESKAPAGYVIDEKALVFDMTENGVTIEITGVNSEISDIPQTGENGKSGFFIGLIAIALGALIAFFIIRKKNND